MPVYQLAVNGQSFATMGNARGIAFSTARLASISQIRRLAITPPSFERPDTAEVRISGFVHCRRYARQRARGVCGHGSPIRQDF